MTKLTKESELTAGILYCLVTKQFDCDRNEDYDRHDALVYWTGEGFMDDAGDDRYDDWDYAIAQSSTPNAEFVVRQ